MRVLIDTCVVIDLIQNREPFIKEAKEIFHFIANKIVVGYITAKATTDIYYLSHRCTHDSAASKNILNKLFSVLELLDTDAMDCRKAALSPISDYEDAVMVETAIRSEVDCIVTRNLKDFEKSSVPTYSPQAFLEKLKADME